MNQTLDQTLPTRLKLSRVQRLFLMVTQGRVLHVVKNRLKPFVVRAGQRAMKRPAFKNMVDKALRNSPELKLRVHRVLWSEVNLPPRALKIFTDLQDAIAQQTAANTRSAAGDKA